MLDPDDWDGVAVFFAIVLTLGFTATPGRPLR